MLNSLEGRSILNPPEGFVWLHSLAGWESDGQHVLATGLLSDGGQATIQFYCLSARAWRMVFTPDGRPLPELGIFEPLPAPLAVEASEAHAPGGSRLWISGTESVLQIDRDPWRLSLLVDGQVRCRENPDDVDGLNRLFILPLGFIRGPQGDVTRVTESFYLQPDERLYGLGEKFTRLDKVGQRVISWTLDALGAASERAYKNVPLLLSSRGYALFLNTGRRCTFELGTQSCETYSIFIDGPYLDLFLIAGDTLAEQLAEYTNLTGHAPVPPKWSFGLWLSGSGVYRDEAGLRQLMDGVDRHRLPCDVIHVDPWWMRWRKYADFQWDLEAFPDPAALISDLHDRNLHLSAWQHPYISIESELFEYGAQQGYFVLRPDGEVYVIDYGLSLSTLPGGVTQVAGEGSSWNAPVAIIDLTYPAAVEWYQSLMRPVLEAGLDVFKTDFGEDIPADAVFSNGLSGEELHNLYPLYYNRVVAEATQATRGYDLVWARSGWAGCQRYPVCWSGDPACTWASLAFTLRGGLSLGLSGMPFWSNDIGGYRGHPSEKLYIRWAQFGLLCSHARCHGESQREPWHFGQVALDIFRRYAVLRYQLFPYLYSCAIEASQTGLPVLRAMPLAFPADPNAHDKDLQFMLGPWLLVAPIYDETDQRWVYLPPGRWFDYWSGDSWNGPLGLPVQAAVDRLPLFVRQGAVLPLMLPALRIPQGWIDPLILDCYPVGEFRYSLLEDEGVSEISGAARDGELQLAISSPLSRAFYLILHIEWNPSRCQLQSEAGSANLPWERLDATRLQINLPACRQALVRLAR